MQSSQTILGSAIRVIAVLAVGGLAACTPYAFSDSATSLATKMTAIDTASKDTAQKIAAEKRRSLHLEWVETRPRLASGPGCKAGSDVSVACDLIVAGKSPPEKAAPPKKAAAPKADVCEPVPVASTLDAAAPAKPPPAETRELVSKQLDAYFAALAAVTNAKDRADFNTATAQIGSAVGGLAASAGTPGAGTLATAGTNAAFWLVGEGFDYRRLRELREATRAACEPIHVLTGALRAVLDEQKNSRLTGLTDLLIGQVSEANKLSTAPQGTDAVYGAAIEAAQTTADAYQAVKAVDPAATAQALSDAHDAFVVAVRNNDGEFKEIVASLTALGQQVAAVEAGAKADAARPVPAKTTASKATASKTAAAKAK